MHDNVFSNRGRHPPAECTHACDCPWSGPARRCSTVAFGGSMESWSNPTWSRCRCRWGGGVGQSPPPLAALLNRVSYTKKGKISALLASARTHNTCVLCWESEQALRAEAQLGRLFTCSRVTGGGHPGDASEGTLLHLHLPAGTHAEKCLSTRWTGLITDHPSWLTNHLNSHYGREGFPNFSMTPSISI